MDVRIVPDQPSGWNNMQKQIKVHTFCGPFVLRHTFHFRNRKSGSRDGALNHIRWTLVGL